MTKVLIFVTNHSVLGETSEKNGTYSPELTHALSVFQAAGYSYDIASINGGAAPIYGEDIEDGVNEKILADDVFQSSLSNTIPASEVKIDDYDLVFYPGGFGLLSDLAKNVEVAKLTAKAWESGKVVGAVCHGPAGLLPVELSDGSKLLADKHITGFTREEEVDFETIDKVPYLMEEALVRASARYSKIPPWGEFVVVDGKLVTGQNPASAHAVGEAMVKLHAGV